MFNLAACWCPKMTILGTRRWCAARAAKWRSPRPIKSQSIRREGYVWVGLFALQTQQQCNSCFVDHNAAPQISGWKWTLLKGVKKIFFYDHTITLNVKMLTYIYLLILLIFGIRQITSEVNFLSPTFMPCRPAASLVAQMGDIATNQQPCWRQNCNLFNVIKDPT